jgi:hypothetical protein
VNCTALNNRITQGRSFARGSKAVQAVLKDLALSDHRTATKHIYSIFTVLSNFAILNKQLAPGYSNSIDELIVVDVTLAYHARIFSCKSFLLNILIN